MNNESIDEHLEYRKSLTLHLKANRSFVKRLAKKCDDCGGKGLLLNLAGEPDECPFCKGDTIITSLK